LEFPNDAKNAELWLGDRQTLSAPQEYCRNIDRIL